MSEDRRNRDPLDHEELESLVAASALDALDPDDQTVVDAHLADCPGCRDLLDSLRETAADLSTGLETPPPPRLRESVLGAVRAEAAAQEQPAPATSDPARAEAPSSRLSRRALIGGGFALAASALVATGVVVARPWRSEEEKDIDQVLDAQDARTYRATWKSAQVTLTHSSSRSSSVLEVEGMDPAPSGRDYQVWSLAKGKAASAGLLRPGENGDARVLVPADAADGAAVTLEPSGGSEQPTSDPFLALDYS
ncbi:hypothetical protein DEO23_01475 [Brachybacterium endophyticum]|uniref:Regulator of SigK n=1 Tax=Brachybacterium endophyticum TaxID=2182385 RepID=A0A2U2RNC4_9MICO|nr:anti-sigma factor [Brachybacterium endophyticum]PWH07346.1 hypothetical protein DEO23_01475 [Brachybacterium endophyticum]